MPNYSGFSDLISGINRSGRTGILEITADEGETKAGVTSVVNIYFLKGEIVLNLSAAGYNGVCNYLLEKGKINAEISAASVEMMKNSGRPLGAILVEQGFIIAEDLLEAVRHTASEMIVGLCALDKGRFSFIEAPFPMKGIVASRLNIPDLVGMVRQKKAGGEKVAGTGPQGASAKAGAVPEDATVAKPDDETVEKIERLYHNYRELGYYGILGIGPESSPDEIRHAYHKVAKEYHPDSYLHFSSDSLKAKLNDIFIYINEAYRAVSRETGRHSRQAAPQTGPASVEDNKALAKMRFEEGKELFERGRSEEALTLLGQAAYLDKSVATYQFHYGIALLKNGKVKLAEEAVRAAAVLSPGNSHYLTELGYIYLHLGFNARAKHMFEKALSVKASNARAAEGLNKAEELLRSAGTER